MKCALYNPHLRSKIFILINESFFLRDYVHLGAREQLQDRSPLMSSDRLDKRGWLEMCVHADQLIRTTRGAQLSFPLLSFWPLIVSMQSTKAVSLPGNVMEKINSNIY